MKGKYLKTEYYYDRTKKYSNKWQLIYYTPLHECELCNKVSTPKNVHYRDDCYAWACTEYDGYCRVLDYEMSEKYIGMLCQGCYNKVRPIQKTQYEFFNLRKLINKIVYQCRGNNMAKDLVLDKSDLVRKIENFGDARRFVLQTMVMLRDGTIPINTGMAIAANMKVVNDNIQAEINQAKLALLANEKGHEFGRIAQMGKNIIDG